MRFNTIKANSFTFKSVKPISIFIGLKAFQNERSESEKGGHFFRTSNIKSQKRTTQSQEPAQKFIIESTTQWHDQTWLKYTVIHTSSNIPTNHHSKTQYKPISIKSKPHKIKSKTVTHYYHNHTKQIQNQLQPHHNNKHYKQYNKPKSKPNTNPQNWSRSTKNEEYTFLFIVVDLSFSSFFSLFVKKRKRKTKRAAKRKKIKQKRK